MSRYYLDTEFDGFGGPLLSVALVRHDGQSFSRVLDHNEKLTPWVAQNVAPLLFSDPHSIKTSKVLLPYEIAQFLAGDSNPIITADWPDDIRYFCESIITGPGEMVGIPALTFHVARVNAYPTTLPGAVQHNAWWDAMALKHMIEPLYA